MKTITYLIPVLLEFESFNSNDYEDIGIDEVKWILKRETNEYNEDEAILDDPESSNGKPFFSATYGNTWIELVYKVRTNDLDGTIKNIEADLKRRFQMSYGFRLMTVDIDRNDIKVIRQHEEEVNEEDKKEVRI